MKRKVIWFTGLSGSGKTTLSKILNKKLLKLKLRVNVVDGDNFREKKLHNNNFSKKNIINNNLSIINHIIKIQKKYDFILVSVISPLLRTRNFAKKKFGDKYYEIYVKCKIGTLEKRDPKKLYAKARKKIIKNLIGYNSKIKYETSKYKKIIIDTDKHNKSESINILMKKIFNEKKYQIY